MNLLRFAESILARHEALHQLEVARIEPQGAVNPDLNDVQQFVEVDPVHAPAGGRECRSGFDGQQVGRDHLVEDGDVVELHG